MQQYNVDFFNRDMSFAHNATTDSSSIDDDYISSTVNVIDIPSTWAVTNGQFIRLEHDKYFFFGLVSDVSPGDYLTRVSFKSFLTIFDEDVLFDTKWQGTGRASERPTLEQLLYNFIRDTYITTDDTYQRLPISVSIDPSITQTLNWGFNIRSEQEEQHHTPVNLYTDLIVRSLKEFGVVIDVVPNFGDKVINLVVTKRSQPFNISADLDNVAVKTLKYSDQNVGTNKLIVYNANNFNQSVTFYVHPDRTWDLDNVNRITPVVREIKTATPEDETTAAFAEAALDVAYGSLSGSAWDNLIEIDAYADDINVTPMSLSIGQVVTIFYKEAKYTSILTGRKLDGDKITLMFGSERITYSKRRKLNGGK